MKWIGSNHAFVVWAACFLWLLAIFEILWSLLLFFCVGDILFLTGTDLVNAFVLLSGVIMLPTNIHMLYAVAHGRTINHKEKVICCPLWLCILCVILINASGAVLCVQRMLRGAPDTYRAVRRSMDVYRLQPDVKLAIDKLQCSLKCCGSDSYTDWFSCNWYERAVGLEPDEGGRGARGLSRFDRSFADSVPFSCCKSGACVATFLSELGADSINTVGCGLLLYRIVVFSMAAHFFIFISVIFVEALLLRFIIKSESSRYQRYDDIMRPEVHGIMSVNKNFVHTSASHVATSTNGNRSRGSRSKEDVTLKIKQDIFKEAGLLTFIHSKSEDFSSRNKSNLYSYGDRKK